MISATSPSALPYFWVIAAAKTVRRDPAAWTLSVVGRKRTRLSQQPNQSR